MADLRSALYQMMQRKSRRKQDQLQYSQHSTKLIVESFTEGIVHKV